MIEIPWIVCLCGSTRFRRQFADENRRLTLKGEIVISVGFFRGDHDIAEDEKARLDELHLRKIDMADEVRVVNPGGYIGDSTRREIEYALNEDKLVTWLEEMPGTQGCCETCLYIGYVDVGGSHAPREFMAKGWKSVPRRKDGTGGYWLCPGCADTPEREVEMARMAR